MADVVEGMRLTVVVPARNEERVLRACLESLVGQSEVGFRLGVEWELIVVDDGSADRTAEIAAGIARGREGVVVMEAPALDTTDLGGFTGKNAACWMGAQAARGEWLLFTDADTVHTTGDLSRALYEAGKHKVGLLSYSPRQVVAGFGQRVVMPLVFGELASVYPPKKVSDPGSRLAAANGQFVLVEREAYFAVGGHRAVGKEILEDVALARRVKGSGEAIRFRYAPDALSTRMYGTFGEMVEGWTKNLALLFPKPVLLAGMMALQFCLFFGLPLLAVLLPGLEDWKRLALLVVWLRTTWGFYRRVARSNFAAADVAVSVLGVPVFCWLLVRSYVRHAVNKTVDWKGRSYRVGR
jgi:cellulose synthase/poly-beta-1,6-N-acetylglucosamine synthase-like glycosyltransferase